MAHAGCSIEYTMMTRPSGELAMILIASLPPDVPIEALKRALDTTAQEIDVQLSLCQPEEETL